MVVAVQQLSAMLLLILGMSLVLRADLWTRFWRELAAAPWLGIPFDLLLLVVGLLIVIYHNVWLASWVVIITLFGWLLILKGLLFLLFPTLANPLTRLPDKRLNLAARAGGTALTLLGGFVSVRLFFP